MLIMRHTDTTASALCSRHVGTFANWPPMRLGEVTAIKRTCPALAGLTHRPTDAGTTCT